MDEAKRVSRQEMEGFVKEAFEFEAASEREVSLVPEKMADYFDSLIKEDRPMAIEVFISIKGGFVPSSKVINPGEINQSFKSFGAWGASALGCLRNCVEARVSLEFIAGTMCRFLYAGTRREDRIAIFDIILSFDFTPCGSVRFKGKRSHMGCEN
jgi:hypothetical protein